MYGRSSRKPSCPCVMMGPAAAWIRTKLTKRVAQGEPHVIRFKMPEEGATTAHDHLRGDITVENRNLDDYILVKSDGLALYHLAAMVDDHLMKITHVHSRRRMAAHFSAARPDRPRLWLGRTRMGAPFALPQAQRQG